MGAFDRKIRLSYPWRFVAVGFIVIFLMFGTRFSFGLYIKALADNFGASRASISFSQSLYMITYAVVALMAGSIADRIGPKRVLIVGAFFLAGGILLGGSINSVWQYYFSYGVIAAIGSGALYVPVVGAVSKLFTRRRNLALALAASGAGIGQYVIPPLMETIIESHGWQASFYVLGLLILAGGVGVPWALLRGGAVREEMGSGPAESAESRGAGRKGDSGHYSLRQALSTRPFWAYFAMYFIICFVIDGIVFVHIYPYLTDIGFSGRTAAGALGILGLISTAAMVIFSPLGDRLNKRIMLTLLMAVHTVLLLWLTEIRTPFSLWAFVLFYGIVLGGIWPLTVSVLADLFGTRGVTSILGACTMAFGIAGLIGPWLGGYIFDRYHSYAPIFYLTVALSFFGAVCAFYTRKTKEMARPESAV